MSALLTSQSAFPPRKEFLKNQNTTHQFALLTFNGAEILRLSNFPPNVIASLRTLFQQQLVYRAYREDPEMGVSEFIMADRLWASKNVKTERLVTLIFSVILSHRFRFVTTLAYGRLAQDTRSLVFSKAVPASLEIPSSSRGNSPMVPASPLPLSSPSSGEGSRPEQRTCFALSLSQKTLRVICAPKGSTPAILASVRSAWPRGVVSEGRPEDDVYEFQLKGYSLFSTSTFDRDALVHIFGLLRALDSHSFQLVTNLNLTQGIAKSRTKDLWIFDCPADPPSPPHSQHAPSIGGGRSPHSSLLGVVPLISKGKEPERVLSVATATTAGMAGLGAGPNNGFYTTPEGQAHIRAATAPSPLSREQRISIDSGTSGVFAAHTRASTAPFPTNLERRPSVLKKHPPGAFGPGEKPSRKNSTSSMQSLGSLRDRTTQPQPEPQVVVRPPEDPNPIPPPPPFRPGYSYQSHALTTSGPLTESEYAYGYSGVYDAQTQQGRHPDSEYLYKQYVPPPPPPPLPPTGTAPSAAVIYSTQTRSNENHSPGSSGPQSPGTEEGLLSSDAFRETAYSGTSEATPIGTNSTPASPTDSQHTHTRNERRGGGGQERHQQVTPRTAQAPLPQQPEMSVQYTGMEGRPKSEKAFMGIIPPPPASTYPLPSAVPVPIPPPDERPGAPRMETATSAATVLPPGGYPKTPLESSTSVKIVPVERVIGAAPGSPASTTRPRQGSQGTVGGGAGKKASALGRTLSRKSVQDPAGDSPGGKGWVLVNVEPSRKASLDAAVAAMDAAAANARVRHRSTSSNPGLNNAGMVTEGAMMTSPVETFGHRGGHIRDNTIDTLDSPVDRPAAGTEESMPHSLLSKRRGGSLRQKQQRSGSSDDSQKKKRFLGLFSMGSKSKAGGGHKKMASEPGLMRPGMWSEEPIGERGEYEVGSPISDDRLDERDDSAGAVDGVKESTWRRVRDPKAPTPVSKLTIG